jgi:hypothetical protein
MVEEHFRRWQEKAAAYGHGHDEHEQVPERTTPQGTQENGVENQHEERDVEIGDLWRWFVGLGAATLVILLLLWGVFTLLLQREKKKDRVPSELFTIRQPFPGPPLIPNPDDARSRPLGPLRGPIQYRADVKKNEDTMLRTLGLQKEDGLPQIPPGVLDQVLKGQGLGSAPPGGSRMWPGSEVVGPGTRDSGLGTRDPRLGPPNPMPSDSSGGTMDEDRLR